MLPFTNPSHVTNSFCLCVIDFTLFLLISSFADKCCSTSFTNSCRGKFMECESWNVLSRHENFFTSRIFFHP